MEKLKKFLFDLSVAKREQFAARCRTTWPHLRNVAYGQRTASERLAVLIERESGGVVTRRDLYPDDWQEIWPELVDSNQDVGHV